jgi:hypothetical protein
MHPEEPLVPPLAMPLANRPPGVLVQKLANHRLCDRVDDRRVCRRTAPNGHIRGLNRLVRRQIRLG